MLKRIIFQIFLSLILINWAYQTSAQNNKFKVGISLPLTGALTEYGDAVQKGFLLAQEDYPDKFKDIELIFEDNSYLPQKAVGNYQKLVKIEKVNLFYVWGTEVAIATAQVAEKDHTAAMLGCLDPKCSKGKEYSIRLFPDYSALASQYAKHDLFKNAIAIKSESTFFNGQIEYLEEVAGNKFKLAENVLPTDTDLSATILRIKDKQFDMLGMYLYAPQIKIFLNTLKTYQLQPKIFATTPLFNKKVIKEYKEQLQDAYITHFNINNDFIARYVKRFGIEDQVVYAGAAYENALLMAEAFGEKDNKLFGKPVLDKIKRFVKTLKSSPNGEYMLKHNQDNGWYFDIPTALYQVKGEEIVKVE